MRERTFLCVDCGQVAEQSRRGGRVRTRCPECQPKYLKQYFKDYYINKLKPKREENGGAGVTG